MTDEEKLKRLTNFCRFIATDYVELSHDKIKWQRDDYIKKARKLFEEINSD